MFSRPFRWTVLFCFVSFIGCSDDDGGSQTDAQVSHDSSTVDQGGTTTGQSYHAAAGIGDLLNYTLDLTGMTYSYQIIESEYGLANQTGSGTLTKNADGTYSTSNDPAQLIVLPNNMIIGGAEIGEGDQTTTMAFAGVPTLTTNYSPAEIAGVYNYVDYHCDEALVGGVCTAGYRAYHGTFRVKTDNTLEICDEGDIEDATNHPCTDGVGQGTWSDRGNGLIDVTFMGMSIATAMVLPSANGGKVLVVDMKNVNMLDQGPGLVIGVKRQALLSENISGNYNYVDTDLEYGVATFPDPNNSGNTESFSILHTDDQGQTNTIAGTFTRDAPWTGWLQSQDGLIVLVLPGDGVFIYMDPSDNTFVGFGGTI